MKNLLGALCLFAVVFACKSQQIPQSTDSTPQVSERTAETDRRPPRDGQRGPRGGGDRASRLNELFKMDTNNDGKLSEAEVSGHRIAQRFSIFDADKDGYITREEFQNAPRPQRRPGGGNQ